MATPRSVDARRVADGDALVASRRVVMIAPLAALLVSALLENDRACGQHASQTIARPSLLGFIGRESTFAAAAGEQAPPRRILSGAHSA